ncbi:hypothetical protein KKI93_10440 [Xenorhabdus bovienii]|uniref:hypothetical protein n=1 Tax=Xenorhabdus bovienii TaxID=40576 RepID=UPI0023B26847|nr:hypothetical protein [Xenorhabdus bovienii]MDE9564475.1 hypothetical protein [Xenorhabdus bovienii]
MGNEMPDKNYHDDSILKLDKKYITFLLKAISAAQNSDLAVAMDYDISRFYIEFRNYMGENNRSVYPINFYQIEVTEDNWMYLTPRSAGGINVDLNVETGEVMYVYGDR